MVALSPPSHELRCHGKHPERVGRLCNRPFAHMQVPYVRVQSDGWPLICPRCGSITRFEPAPAVEVVREAA